MNDARANTTDIRLPDSLLRQLERFEKRLFWAEATRGHLWSSREFFLRFSRGCWAGDREREAA